MSTNLATSRCPECKYHVRLADVRGKPLETRRYRHYAPQFGVRFDCPCGQVYFVILRHKDTFWGQDTLKSGDWKEPQIRLPPEPGGGALRVRSRGDRVLQPGFGVL